jgi:hypothetical protein
VDSVDFFASLALAKELHPAHNRLDNAPRCPHDHKADDYFLSSFSRKNTAGTTIGCLFLKDPHEIRLSSQQNTTTNTSKITTNPDNSSHFCPTGI